MRRRLRSLYLVHGLGRMLLILTLLATLSFAIDYVLEPPRAVRLVHGLVSLAVAAWALRRFLLGPLGRPVSDEELAQAIEARVPALEDRLIGALQWDRLLEDPQCGESRSFMEAAAAEAAERVRAVRVENLVRTRPSRRSFSMGAVVAGAAVVMAMAFPAETALWVRRSLLFQDVPWPQRTTLHVIDFDPLKARIVTLGDDLSVEVRVEGRIPDDGVLLHFAATDGPGGDGTGDDVEDMHPMMQSTKEPASFRYVFNEIPSSFRFWVTGGDDDDGEPVYTVTALVPPAIESVTAALTFPPETGMAPETREAGDLSVPAGTRAALTIVSSVPLTTAWMVHPVGSARKPLTLASDGRTILTSVAITESADWRVDMVGRDGALSVDSRNTRRFTAIPDPRPDIRMMFPAARMYSVAGGRLPVKISAADNYSLRDVELRIRVGREADAMTMPLASWTPNSGAGESVPDPSGDGAPTIRETRIYRLLDLGQLPGTAEALSPETEILLVAAAGDNGGSVSTTDTVVIQIAEPAELLRRLSQRQARLREDLERIRRNLEEALRGAVRAEKALTGGGSLAAEDRDALRTPATQASRARRESAAFLDNLGNVVQVYTWNRLLENRVATERTVAVMDGWMREHEAEDTVFPADLWRRLSQAHGSREIDDRSILGALLEAMGLTDRLHEGPGNSLQERLTGLASGELTTAEDAGRAVADADAAIAIVREIGLRLQQWETLHEILEAVRSLEALQGNIADGLLRDGASEPESTDPR